MRVELVSKETSGWVTFDDIYVLKAPPPLIPPPPTSVKYYYFGGQRVAMRRTNHDTNESTLHYLHADHLGSTRLVTDENGDAISTQGYFAFGSERSGGPIPTDHSFTGQKVDASGLLYYNARYYDPVLGVFVSPDTIVPDPSRVIDYNRYAYVRGNPLKFSDPTGHCATTDNGGQDRQNDLQCWTLVDSILNVYDGYFSNKYGISAEQFEKHAEKEGITHEFLFGELLLYNDYNAGSMLPKPIPQSQLDDPVCGGEYFCQQGVATAQSIDEYCGQSDCVAQTLDVVGVGAAGVATACVAGVVTAPCALPAEGISLAAGGIGVVWSGYRLTQDKGTDVDLIAATATFTIGAARNGDPKVGFAASIFQAFWDFFGPTAEKIPAEQ